MAPAQDAIELLLPEADERELAHARRVTTFLRLLANDARPAHALTVQVDLGRARGVMEGEDRRRLRGALLDLLRAHLAAAAGPESFLWCGRTRLEPAVAWRVLDELRDELDGLAELPGPGERARDVAHRLLASLGWLEESEPSATGEAGRLELELWRARLELACAEPRAAERRARRVETRAREGLEDSSRSVALRCEALAVRVEALLERGAVGAARAALGENEDADDRLRRLDAWARLVAGDFAGARRVLVGLPPWTGPLPAPLAELRERRPAWLPCLAGRSPACAPADRREHEPREGLGAGAERTDLGASVLAVFAFHPERGALPIEVDVAPALRDGTRTWLADREDAFAVPSTPEHRLIVRAEPSIEHRAGDAPLAGALGGTATRALVRLPAFGPDVPPATDSEGAGEGAARRGEVAGWVHLELEHHLVPGATTLARLVARWRPAVLARLADPEAGVPIETELEPAAASPSAGVFGELVAALGIKTTQRLWWGWELEGGAPRLVARGGGGAGFGSRTTRAGVEGGRVPRALERARVTGGGVLFDEPAPSLSVHPDAASGMVVPLRLPVPERVRRGATMTGLLVIESSRRRDFGREELERFLRVAETFAPVHLCARYRAWSRERFGVDVRLDARDEGFRELGAHLFAAARSRAPALVAGPPGAGKRVLARFLHFSGERPHGPVVSLAHAGSEGGPLRAWKRARGGTLLVEHVERLGPAARSDLVRLLASVSRGETSASVADLPPRIVATTRGPADGSFADLLGEELAQRFSRVHVRAPALAERRVELPGLAAFLARRSADEEGLPRPELADDALALLWRQPWPGNVRELEALVHKLVLLHPGETIAADDVRALARHHGLELVRRLPSRRPERAAIVAALRTTRTAGGRANKTRAALYLGWDPDTLVSRMADQGISGPDDPYDAAT